MSGGDVAPLNRRFSCTVNSHAGSELWCLLWN